MANKKEKKLKLSTALVAITTLVLSVIFLVGVALYVFGLENRVVKYVAMTIPYPVAMVDGWNFITHPSLYRNLDSVRGFYENQDLSGSGLRVDFSTEDGKKRLEIKEKQILNKMIEDLAIEVLAKKVGISISNDFVNQNVERKIQEYGSDRGEIEARFKNLYGWSMSDFEREVVRPALFKEELEKKFKENNEKYSEAGRVKIEDAKNELDEEKDFVEVAKKYSDEDYDIGWFKRDQLVSVVSEIVFTESDGLNSNDIIESELGFHIIKVVERTKKDGEELARIQQIFVRKRLFADWLDEQMKKMKIRIFSNKYAWDNENAIAVFRSDGLKEFERKAYKEYNGDASIFSQ